MPWLRYEHPGYFLVVLSLVLVHAGLGVDSLLPGRHDTPIFTYVKPMLPLLGFAHFIVFFALATALYLPQSGWHLGRLACLLSFVTFNTTGILMTVAVIGEPLASPSGPLLYATISMSSAAAVWEPINRRLTHNDDD